MKEQFKMKLEEFSQYQIHNKKTRFIVGGTTCSTCHGGNAEGLGKDDGH